MRTSKPYLLVGASIGVVFAGAAVFALLAHPRVVAKLFGGGKSLGPRAREDWLVDTSSEDSFPASDPPSNTPYSVR